MVTPTLWLVDWPARLPLWASSYLEQDTGSLVSAVSLERLHPARGRAGAALCPVGRVEPPGVCQQGAAGRRCGDDPGRLGASALCVDLFGGGQWTFIPPEVLLRVGTCLLILGGIAHGTGYIASAAARVRRRRPGNAADLLRPPLYRLRVHLGARLVPGLYGPTLGAAAGAGGGAGAHCQHDGARLAVELAQAHVAEGRPGDFDRCADTAGWASSDRSSLESSASAGFRLRYQLRPDEVGVTGRVRSSAVTRIDAFR